MKKNLFLLTLIIPLIAFAQWNKTSLGEKVIKNSKKSIESTTFYSLDKALFKQKLNNAPDRLSKLPGNIITMPTANGNMEKFEIWEASNFSPVLQAKFPDIKSYVGIGIDDPTLYIRFSFSPYGLSSMILRSGGSEFIEPYTEDGTVFVVFNSKTHRNNGELPFECSTPKDLETLKMTDDIEPLPNANTGKFQTYRLAMSVTGEYTAYHGGTVASAMAAINTTMTRVNGVFEKDFGINMILIDNNDEIVFTDASTDPYTSPGVISTTQGQLQTYLDNNIGFNNYDIGHIFHRIGGGGSAGCIGCICDAGKGRGYTSAGNGSPEGDSFDIDYVAHEIGHQIGANHTFSYGNEGLGIGIEPGSGSTIMGYAGTTNYDVQQNSDDYFSYKSIYQVETNLNNKACANNVTLTNQAPIVDAGEAVYFVPNGTAYVLRGSATDPDGDAMNYNWEQNDPGTSATTNANSRVSPTKTAGPNFRSLPHTNEPVRYMPKFSLVLAGTLTSTSEWESINTNTRVSKFVLTVRDNNPEGGQTNYDYTTVRTIGEIGPFVVTTPTLNEDVDLSVNSINVTWDVAGTDTTPINTTNVKISLSTDGGNSFTELIASTPNDGSETLALPTGTVAGNNNRIMIEAIDNIYYAVSKKFNFTGTMGVSDASIKSNFSIYPNPSNGSFTLTGADIAGGKVNASIYDMSGKLVHTSSFDHNGGALNKAFSINLPTGVYNVVINSAKSKLSQKLIIK